MTSLYNRLRQVFADHGFLFSTFVAREKRIINVWKSEESEQPTQDTLSAQAAMTEVREWADENKQDLRNVQIFEVEWFEDEQKLIITPLRGELDNIRDKMEEEFYPRMREPLRFVIEDAKYPKKKKGK